MRNVIPGLLLAGFLALGAGAEAPATVGIEVYKTPTCGCCSKWIDHLESHGFEVKSHDLKNLSQLKREHGVPPVLASCHTAIVDGYVIEGHVPASDVARLLEERPAVRGLAVPGMPMGSPGMEGPRPVRYRVYSFDASGARQVFSTHSP